MAQNAKPAAQKPDDPTVPKGSKKKLFIIIGIVLAVAGAGGGGWFFTKGKSGDRHAEEVKVIPPKIPMFLPLDPFTVNLKSEGSDQYLQMGISLKYFNPELEAKIKLNLPEVRSKILQLLTTKTANELLTGEGKNKLVKQITTLTNTTIGIIEVPVQALPASAPVAPAHVAEQGAEAQDATEAVGAPAVAAAPVVKAPAEKNGIIDVLFTSFIIQ